MWRRYLGAVNVKPWHRGAVILLLIAIPFAFAEKLRFDREYPKPHLRMVTAAAKPLIPKDARLFILDPAGSESGVMTRFDLGRHLTYTGQLVGAQSVTAATIRARLAAKNTTDALIFSVTPAVAEALALPLTGTASYLVSRTGNGPWQIKKSWPFPARS